MHKAIVFSMIFNLISMHNHIVLHSGQTNSSHIETKMDKNYNHVDIDKKIYSSIPQEVNPSIYDSKTTYNNAQNANSIQFEPIAPTIEKDIKQFMGACLCGCDNNTCTQILKKYEKEPSIIDLIINKTIPSPLVLCAINGNTDLLNKILPYIQFEKNIWNESAFYFAIKMHRNDIAEILYAHPYFINKTTFYTMFHADIETFKKASTIKKFLIHHRSLCKKHRHEIYIGK